MNEGVDGRNVIIRRKEIHFDFPFSGVHFIEHNVIKLKAHGNGNIHSVSTY